MNGALALAYLFLDDEGRKNFGALIASKAEKGEDLTPEEVAGIAANTGEKLDALDRLIAKRKAMRIADASPAPAVSENPQESPGEADTASVGPEPGLDPAGNP